MIMMTLLNYKIQIFSIQISKNRIRNQKNLKRNTQKNLKQKWKLEDQYNNKQIKKEERKKKIIILKINQYRNKLKINLQRQKIFQNRKLKRNKNEINRNCKYDNMCIIFSNIC